MKWNILWIISFILEFHDAVGTEETCLTNKFIFCHHLLPNDITEDAFPPNVEELKELCPSVLKYYECLKEYDQICASVDLTSETIASTTDVVREICEKGSLLHEAYASSFACFKSIANASLAHECERTAEFAVNAYHIIRSEEGEVDDMGRSHYRYCMEKSYKMVCLASRIDQMCDEIALSTFLELLHRSKYLAPICSESTVKELSEDFLEILDLEKQERILANRVFEIRSK